MSLPCRSRARARFRTSNAVSVPSRDMRSAKRNSNWTALDIGQNGLLYYSKERLNHKGHELTRRKTSSEEISFVCLSDLRGLVLFVVFCLDSVSSVPSVVRDFQKRPPLPCHRRRTWSLIRISRCGVSSRE